MKALVLYFPNSEHARSVDEFSRNIQSKSGKTVELLSLETVEGANKAEVYGVIDYPAVMVLADDGSMHKFWEGKDLPLVDEVLSYLIA